MPNLFKWDFYIGIILIRRLLLKFRSISCKVFVKLYKGWNSKMKCDKFTKEYRIQEVIHDDETVSLNSSTKNA